MFGWKNRKTVIKRPPASEPESVAAPAVAADPHEPHDALLQRWMSLADMQQRVIKTLVSEIQQASAVVDVEADNLSSRFQRLAVCAERQTTRVEALSKLAVGIEVDSETVPIDRIAGLLDETLSAVVEKILLLSKDSMSMVYALGGVAENIGRVDSCMVELSKINRTTNMLALNARIEAERAGIAGAAFRVVAGEVRELSRATQHLSVDMAAELKAITEGIAEGHSTLRRVATIDMSQNIMAKERLEHLMAALINRSALLKEVVGDAMKEAEVISADVTGMITGIQFQDRTRQRLEHVVDTLEVLDGALEELKQATAPNVPPREDGDADVAWLKRLLDRFTLGELRSRFVAQIFEGRQPGAAADDLTSGFGPSATGTVELF